MNYEVEVVFYWSDYWRINDALSECLGAPSETGIYIAMNPKMHAWWYSAADLKAARTIEQKVADFSRALKADITTFVDKVDRPLLGPPWYVIELRDPRDGRAWFVGESPNPPERHRRILKAVGARGEVTEGFWVSTPAHGARTN